MVDGRVALQAANLSNAFKVMQICLRSVDNEYGLGVT